MQSKLILSIQQVMGINSKYLTIFNIWDSDQQTGESFLKSTG